jgi:hypothetical protein
LSRQSRFLDDNLQKKNKITRHIRISDHERVHVCTKKQKSKHLKENPIIEIWIQVRFSQQINLCCCLYRARSGSTKKEKIITKNIRFSLKINETWLRTPSIIRFETIFRIQFFQHIKEPPRDALKVITVFLCFSFPKRARFSSNQDSSVFREFCMKLATITWQPNFMNAPFPSAIPLSFSFHVKNVGG